VGFKLLIVLHRKSLRPLSNTPPRFNSNLRKKSLYDHHNSAISWLIDTLRLRVISIGNNKSKIPRSLSVVNDILLNKRRYIMASRLSALKESAKEAGEQIGQRAMQVPDQEQARSLALFAVVAIAGFALGMLSGLLLAPMSGAETRDRLQNRASDMLSNVKQMAKKGEEQVSEQEEQIAS
jgi:hypothetical protein